MKTCKLIAIFLGISFAAALGRAGENHSMAPYMGSAEFQKLKNLAGAWEGMETGKNNQKVRVEYSVTSGGSALVEKLMPGTPHEMVSIYHDEKGKVGMTHYCMLQNHPRMELKKADSKELDFSLAKDGGVSLKEPHMHALSIVFNDVDHITHKWTSFENGKEKDHVVFDLTRVK